MPKPRIVPVRRPLAPNRLQPFSVSGANPGALAAQIYVPDRTTPKTALVVVLHGCTQTPGGYDHGSGWSMLAERHGFLLLYPEQIRANNPNLCFNWFEPRDTTRGQGEVASIRGMIAQLVAERDVDPARIFVTGLSAGGAMAAAMLATYPELFAAGAVIAGLPFGAAASVGEAMERMRAGPGLDDPALAAAVRAASDHAGRWPRLSVWHGSADRIVSSANGSAIARQWALLHGLPTEPTRTDSIAGHPRRAWLAADGTTLIEDHLIAGMGHGTPLASGDGEDRVGSAGAFMLEVGVSSSHAIARFFGLLDAAGKSDSAPRAAEPPARGHAVEPIARRLEPIGRTPHAAPDPPSGIKGVIEGALRSAGLMK